MNALTQSDLAFLAGLHITPGLLPPSLERLTTADMIMDTTVGFDDRGEWRDRSLDDLSPEIADYQSRPRRITPEAGHALEKLGHAIEYLSDQYIWDIENCDVIGNSAAIEVLMAANLQVYYECPIRPTFREWVGGVIDRLARKWGMTW